MSRVIRISFHKPYVFVFQYVDVSRSLNCRKLDSLLPGTSMITLSYACTKVGVMWVRLSSGGASLRLLSTGVQNHT